MPIVTCPKCNKPTSQLVDRTIVCQDCGVISSASMLSERGKNFTPVGPSVDDASNERRGRPRSFLHRSGEDTQDLLIVAVVLGVVIGIPVLIYCFQYVILLLFVGGAFLGIGKLVTDPSVRANIAKAWRSPKADTMSDSKAQPSLKQPNAFARMPPPWIPNSAVRCMEPQRARTSGSALPALLGILLFLVALILVVAVGTNIRKEGTNDDRADMPKAKGTNDDRADTPKAEVANDDRADTPKAELTKMQQLIVDIIAYIIVFGAMTGLYWFVASMIRCLFKD